LETGVSDLLPVAQNLGSMLIQALAALALKAL
jgi:hypothetical protein